MEQKTNFAAQVVAQEQAQKHAQEIQQTRIGGLGGSDAAMVLKVGKEGLAALSITDNKRLAVMLELAEPDNFGGNVHTQAGHIFEDYCEQHLPWGAVGYEREKVLEAGLALNFKTFAHADFVTGSERLDVVECKFVQDTTQATQTKYFAQLQWYYMLGAKSVRLAHATGTADPFEVAELDIVEVERDEATIKALLAGLRLIDEAISDGWRPQVPDKMTITDTPSVVQQAFAELQAIKAQEDELKERKDAAVTVIREYMESWQLTGITSADENGGQVVYTKASVSRSFDSAALLKAHPEFVDVPEYYKTVKRAASVSFRK